MGQYLPRAFIRAKVGWAGWLGEKGGGPKDRQLSKSLNVLKQVFKGDPIYMNGSLLKNIIMTYAQL